MSESRSALEILPGLFQIRIPIPIRSLGSVFAYLAVSGDHNLLIDAGWDSQEAYIALRDGLEEAGVPIPKLEKIVISHLHPDHFGLSARLKIETPKSKVMMHHSDAISIKKTPEEFEAFLKELHNWVVVNGTPAAELNAMSESSAQMLKFVRPARPDTELFGGEVLEVGDVWRFIVIPTPGHTAGNICLFDLNGSRCFFSGDHVLPTITPNVSLTPLYVGSDPLGDYLTSLTRLRRLKTTKILPSHEFVFSGLSKRLDEIELHHKERLDDTLRALTSSGKDGTSAYSVSSRMRWYNSWENLSPWEKRAALMETLAHLEYLRRLGKVTEIVESNGGIRNVVFASTGNAC